MVRELMTVRVNVHNFADSSSPSSLRSLRRVQVRTAQEQCAMQS